MKDIPQLKIVRVLIFCLFTVMSGTSLAQSDFPTRLINLVCPYPPGGAVDQAARSIAQSLFKLWNQAVVVNTKPGAGGAIGIQAVANAHPDGYTLLVAAPALLSMPESDRLFGKTPSFERSQFTPIALLSADPVLLVVKADAPWKTFEEFVAYAKKNPDKVPYSSSGNYSNIHLPMEMVAQAAGIKLLHIPYSGGGPALTAVLGGQVAMTAGVPGVVVPQVKSGTMRALLTTGAKRHPQFPDVPTALELGYKNAEFYLWAALFAPAKTPEQIVVKIRKDIGRAVQDGEYIQSSEKMGVLIDYRDGKDFDDFLNKDQERLSNTIKRIGKVE
jgi:tripartite-type tricarboxylate transporter receptor subunit TctC